MRNSRFAAAILVLLLSPALACAQNDVAPFPARPPAMFPELAPNRAAPTFNNVTQMLSTGEQIQTDAPRDGRSQRLSVDITVSIASDPSMANADRVNAMMKSAQNLREAVNRQCEIYVASFNSACGLVRVNFNSSLNGRSSAQQASSTSARAEFELTSPSTAKQEPVRP
jgi:hypothetical protein